MQGHNTVMLMHDSLALLLSYHQVLYPQCFIRSTRALQRFLVVVRSLYLRATCALPARYLRATCALPARYQALPHGVPSGNAQVVYAVRHSERY